MGPVSDPWTYLGTLGGAAIARRLGLTKSVRPLAAQELPETKSFMHSEHHLTA